MEKDSSLITPYRILDEAQGARRRIRGMMLFRFLGIFFFLAAMLVPTHRDVFLNSQPQIYSLLVFLCILNCVYFLLSGHVRNVRAFAVVQLCIDLVAETCIIYFSGGEGSNFVFLYFTCILGASILLSGRSAVIFASLATILLSAISALSFLAHYNNWALPLPAAPGAAYRAPDIDALFYLLVVHALGFYLVAVLASSLARRVTTISRLTREIVSNFDEGLLVMDSSRRIVYANQRAADLIGHENAARLMNKSIEEILRRESDAELRALLAGDAPAKRELDYVRRKDERLSLEVAIGPLGRSGSRDYSRVVFLKDLTERKRVERAEKLAEQLRGIQEMAAAIAHEVRNPLASIKGSAQELGELALADDDDRRLLDIVCRETDRLDKIISDFMRFAGLRPPKMRRCDLSLVLDDVAALLQARASEKPFELVRAYPRGLFCVADAQQLMQVFLNIGLNAYDAVGPGGHIRIEAELCRAGAPPVPVRARTGMGTGETAVERRQRAPAEKMRIRISDDGPGIPPEIMGKIYSPFFTTKENGVGMGLAIVNRILQQHGIDFDVGSSAERGTTFTLTINATDIERVEHVEYGRSRGMQPACAVRCP